MGKRKLPSQEHLNNILIYNKDTGKLYWKIDIGCVFGRMLKSGDEAFTCKKANRSGFYYVSKMGGVNYYAHRVIWKIVYGEDPIQIDHIDGDKGNNKISNLRSVEHKFNQRNMRTGKVNKYGVVGISFDSVRKKYRVSIGRGKNRKNKRFDRIEDAISQRKVWEEEMGYGPSHAPLYALA